MKSYKICLVREFEKTRFDGQPLIADSQPLLEGVTPPASTSIRESPDRITVEDFESYLVEHEYEEKTEGRLDDRSFTAYIKKAHIPAFYSPVRGVVVLAGKKRDVLDFCSKTERLTGIKIDTIEVDMARLETVLTNINLVWASNKKSQESIRASALMGTHIEQTTEYARLKKFGELTTFAFIFEKNSRAHPIMVTHDGTIVLQSTYRTVSEEMELVLSIYDDLVRQFSAKKEETKRKGAVVTPASG